MKNFLAAAFAFILASTLVVGCGFVDDNPGATHVEDDQQIESTSPGFYSTSIDTTGYDIPG